MKTTLGKFVATSLLLALTATTALAQQSLYGLGLAPNTAAPTLLNFNRTTGEATPIGALGDPAALTYGLAVRNGQFYTFDATTDRIRTINPVTGAFTGAPLDIGIGNLSGEGDLAFSLDGNTGYLTTAFRPGQPQTDISPGLFTFTLAGTSTFVNTTADSLGPITVDGMAVSPTNGLIYALTDVDTRLYILNAVSGFLTPVGELGVTPNSGTGALSFDQSGALLGVINNKLYTISTTTGAATAVGNGNGTDYGSINGLAFGPVPEPTSAALLAIGTLSLLRRRRSAALRRNELAPGTAN